MNGKPTPQEQGLSNRLGNYQKDNTIHDVGDITGSVKKTVKQGLALLPDEAKDFGPRGRQLARGIAALETVLFYGEIAYAVIGEIARLSNVQSNIAHAEGFAAALTFDVLGEAPDTLKSYYKDNQKSLSDAFYQGIEDAKTLMSQERKPTAEDFFVRTFLQRKPSRSEAEGSARMRWRNILRASGRGR